jgi:hypothetical protein
MLSESGLLLGHQTMGHRVFASKFMLKSLATDGHTPFWGFTDQQSDATQQEIYRATARC